MTKSTTIAIDLVKHSFQVCKLHGSSDEFNKAFTRDKLKAWLIQQPPTTMVMEACSTAHYWGRFCCNHEHSVRLIAPNMSRHIERDKKQIRMMQQRLLSHLSKLTPILSL